MISTYLGNRLIASAVISGPTWQATLSSHRAQVKSELSNYSLQAGDNLKTTWHCSGCTPPDCEVVTTWNGSETRDQLIDRHFDAVAAKMTDCPP